MCYSALLYGMWEPWSKTYRCCKVLYRCCTDFVQVLYRCCTDVVQMLYRCCTPLKIAGFLLVVMMMMMMIMVVLIQINSYYTFLGTAHCSCLSPVHSSLIQTVSVFTFPWPCYPIDAIFFLNTFFKIYYFVFICLVYYCFNSSSINKHFWALSPKLRKATINFIVSVRLSEYPSVRPHWTTRLLPEGFSLKLIFEYIPKKKCRENPNFVKICQQ